MDLVIRDPETKEPKDWSYRHAALEMNWGCQGASINLCLKCVIPTKDDEIMPLIEDIAKSSMEGKFPSKSFDIMVNGMTFGISLIESYRLNGLDAYDLELVSVGETHLDLIEQSYATMKAAI